jgi:transposase
MALTRSHVGMFSLPPPCPPAGNSAPTIMAPNLAVAQREQIYEMLQAGRFTVDQIAKVAGCSSQSISAIRSNIRAFGSPRAPFTAAPGRPRSITPTMYDALKELLLRKPGRQLDELTAFLREEFDVEVATSTMSRTLRIEGWSKKMIRRKAKEQNADLRDKYLHELTAFASYHLVYIDESGCDRRLGFRSTGWSPVGVTPVQQRGSTGATGTASSLINIDDKCKEC